jgi:hypothetical protein
MTDRKNKDEGGTAKIMFQVYDPENTPTIKLCICDILRELPELTDENAADASR